MGELITTLGIDGRLLIAQLINFLVLFFLLRKFLYQPLLGMLEQRRILAEEALAKEKDLAQSSHHIEQEREAVLHSAREESRTMIESARARAEEVAESTRLHAEREVQEMKSKTEQELAVRKTDFDRALKQEASLLVEESLKKVIPEVMTPDLDRSLIEKAINESAR